MAVTRFTPDQRLSDMARSRSFNGVNKTLYLSLILRPVGCQVTPSSSRFSQPGNPSKEDSIFPQKFLQISWECSISTG